MSKKRAPVPMQALGFKLEELREARLAPIVNFKGRNAGSQAVDQSDAAKDAASDE